MRRHIPDSPGLSRPAHMDDEEWAEYRMSEEARVELTHVPHPDDLEPSYSQEEEAYADFVAEQEAIEQAEREEED